LAGLLAQAKGYLPPGRKRSTKAPKLEQFFGAVSGAGLMHSRMLMGLLVLAMPAFGLGQSVKSFTFNFPSVVGGASPETGSITLTSPPNATGLWVTITGPISYLGSTGSEKILCKNAAGGTQTTFKMPALSTYPVISSAVESFTATGGGGTALAAFSVNPPIISSVTLSTSTPSPFYGTQTFNGTINLDGPAPAGYTIVLSDVSASISFAKTEVTVTTNSKTVAFSGTANPVASTTNSTIKAAGPVNTGGLQIQVLAPLITGLSLSPGSVNAGSALTGTGSASSIGTVTLNYPAPSTGYKVGLSSSTNVVSFSPMPGSTTAVKTEKVQISGGSGTFNLYTNAGLSGMSVVSAYSVNPAINNTYTATLTVNPASGLANSAWPKFMQNIANTGVGVGTGANGTNAWSFATALPAADYPTSSEWSSAIDGNGNIWFAGGDGVAYSFNSAGVKMGSVSSKTQGFVSCPAIDENNMLYMGTADGYLYQINTVTDKVVWSTHLDPGVAIDTAPNVGTDGTIYVTDINGNLFAVNPSTGSVNWTLNFSLPPVSLNPPLSSPAIAPDGTLYVGTDGYFYAVYTTGSKKGTIKWSYFMNPNGYFQAMGSPALDSAGNIYFGCNDGNLYSLSPAGKLNWTFAEGGAVEATPAIAPDGTIYTSSVNGLLYALYPASNAKWGTPAASLQGTIDGFYGSPAIGSDGTIFVVNGAGYVYAINPTTFLPDQGWPLAVICPTVASIIIDKNGFLYFIDLNGTFHSIH
jgi:outer membrane protein assembly factor BamB